MPRVAANVIQIVPPILSGFMAAGWQGAVVQVIQFIAIVFLYLPFIKRLDKLELKKESVSIV
jgi:PTS system cellobiose-specific IIC component